MFGVSFDLDLVRRHIEISLFVIFFFQSNLNLDRDSANLCFSVCKILLRAKCDPDMTIGNLHISWYYLTSCQL